MAYPRAKTNDSVVNRKNLQVLFPRNIPGEAGVRGHLRLRPDRRPARGVQPRHYCAPLYIYAENGRRESNLNGKIVDSLESVVGSRHSRTRFRLRLRGPAFLGLSKEIRRTSQDRLSPGSLSEKRETVLPAGFARRRASGNSPAGIIESRPVHHHLSGFRTGQGREGFLQGQEDVHQFRNNTSAMFPKRFGIFASATICPLKNGSRTERGEN